MDRSDRIQASDLENVITLEDLATYIKDNIIIPARAGNTSLDELKAEIEKLNLKTKIWWTEQSII